MVVVKVCVGSSCFIKGASEIVEMMEKKVSEGKLDGEIVLVGSFCAGKCILEFRHDTGNLIKRFCILIRIGQKAGKLSDADDPGHRA